MRARFWFQVTGSLFLAGCGYCLGRTNVTGVVVDQEGKPLEGVVCSLTGFGGHIHYSGGIPRYSTDKAGRFMVSLPRGDPLVDLQFDHQAYAPVFLYKIRPAESPLHVVMSKGKVLRGRIVEERMAASVPIPHAPVELQMPQADAWYQKQTYTDQKGEFRFRISEPPQQWSWMLSYAGGRFKIDYDQVKPDTVVTLTVGVGVTLSAEPSGAVDRSQPVSAGTNQLPAAAGPGR